MHDEHEATYAEVDRAIVGAMWLTLMAYESEAIEQGDLDAALGYGALVSEIKAYAREILEDQDHPIWDELQIDP